MQLSNLDEAEGIEVEEIEVEQVEEAKINSHPLLLAFKYPS